MGTDSVHGDPHFNAKQAFAESHPSGPAISTQKLVLDEDVLELMFLTCPTCNQQYNQSHKSPRLLPCHHTLCLECILNLFRDKTDKTDNRSDTLHSVEEASSTVASPTTCPICQTTFLASENALENLTTNKTVTKLIELIGTTEKYEADRCPKHAMQFLTFFCEECKESVCRDCTVLDHKSCAAAKKVRDVKAAKEKYTQVVEKGVEQMETEIHTLKDNREEYAKLLENNQGGDQDLESHIRQTFSKVRKTLGDREQTLLAQATSQTSGVKTEDVEEKIKRLVEKEKEVADIVESLESFKDFSDTEQLYTHYMKLMNYQTEAGIDKDSIRTDAPKSYFVCKDEKMMVIRMKIIGQLQSPDEQDNEAI